MIFASRNTHFKILLTIFINIAPNNFISRNLSGRINQLILILYIIRLKFNLQVILRLLDRSARLIKSFLIKTLL